MKHPLRSHPANPAPPGLRVEVERLPSPDPARPLRLRYSLLGALGAVRVPADLPAEGRVHTDDLWHHTCFEAFLAAPAVSAAPVAGGGGAAPGPGDPYVEFNFAPSGAWACYRFDGYRAGMRAETLAVAPRIDTRRSPDRLEVDVMLPWPQPWPGATAAGAGVRRSRLGLTAVVEAVDGSLSYWALHHPAARAEFHHHEGFTLGLEVPE